jgi:hypothetical protein
VLSVQVTTLQGHSLNYRSVNKTKVTFLLLFTLRLNPLHTRVASLPALHHSEAVLTASGCANTSHIQLSRTATKLRLLCPRMATEFRLCPRQCSSVPTHHHKKSGPHLATVRR